MNIYFLYYFIFNAGIALGLPQGLRLSPDHQNFALAASSSNLISGSSRLFSRQSNESSEEGTIGPQPVNSEDLQKYLDQLKEVSGEEAKKFSFEEASKAVEGSDISEATFSLLASSDNNSTDDLLDPRSIGVTKLVALNILVLSSANSPFLQNEAQKMVNQTRESLENQLKEAESAIEQTYKAISEVKGDVSDEALSEAWEHILGTYKPHAQPLTLFQIIAGKEDGLNQTLVVKLGDAFSTISEFVGEEDSEIAVELSTKIAIRNICTESLEVLKSLDGLLNNSESLNNSADEDITLAGEEESDESSGNSTISELYLQSQIVSFKAPLPSDYVLAGLLESGRIKDLDNMSEDDTSLINGLSDIIAMNGTDGVSDDLTQSVEYAIQLLSKYGNVTEDAANTLASRLKWERGYESTNDNVEEENLDMITMLAAENYVDTCTVFYYSTVANQIRKENPELETMFMTTDTPLKLFHLRIKITFSASDGGLGIGSSSTEYKELEEDVYKSLQDYVIENQLNLSTDDGKKELDKHWREKFEITNENSKLEVIEKSDASAGQSDNLQILSAASIQAYREFDKEGKPLVTDPYSRVAQLTRRLECGESKYNYRIFTNHCKRSGMHLGGSSGCTQMFRNRLDPATISDIYFLEHWIKENDRELDGETETELRAMWKDRNPDADDNESLEISDYNEGDKKLPMVGFKENVPEPVPDREAKSEKNVVGEQLKDFWSLVEISAQVFQGINNGTEIKSDYDFKLALGLGIVNPLAGLMYVLGKKPELQDKQEAIKEWLDDKGRSTEILDQALDEKDEEWRQKVILSAGFLGTEFILQGITMLSKFVSLMPLLRTMHVIEHPLGVLLIGSKGFISISEQKKKNPNDKLMPILTIETYDISPIARDASMIVSNALPAVDLEESLSN